MIIYIILLPILGMILGYLLSWSTSYPAPLWMTIFLYAIVSISVLFLSLSPLAELCLIVTIAISAFAGATINDLKEEIERLKQA